MTTVGTKTGAYILQPGEGRAIPVPFAKGHVMMKAEKHQTGGLITMFESRHEPHSVGPARHYHERLTEMFYVLGGTFTFLVGEQVTSAPTGAVVVIPPGTVHAFHNPEDEPASLLISVLPGGFEGFFDDARELRAPMSDGAQWQQLNERWDTYVVGPPLEK